MGLLNNFLKGNYQKFAKSYAEELLEVLGNEEAKSDRSHVVL